MTVFDIETIPIEGQEAPDFSPPANLKDPAKIEAAIAEKKAKWLEEAALHADRAHVAAVGFLNRMGQTIHRLDEIDEPTLLRYALDRLADTCPIIGFNCLRFDIPFLVRRAMILGVPIPHGSIFDRKGYIDETRFVDILRLWQCGDRQEFISLDRLAQIILGRKKETSGAEFPWLWKEDRAKAIAHLETDLELTMAIAKHLKL